MPNFYLDDKADENFFPTTNLAKIESNIKIIKLAKQLTENKQEADLPEQKVLAKYVGWGGLANEFFDEYNPKFKSQREELKGLVSKEEYEAMRASSLTAYYTNPAIARAMWQKIVGDGFTHGNVLDPSMGTGIFFMTMPEKLRNHTGLYGIELDPITGMIAKLLFPDAKILVKGFEDVDFLGQSRVDLTITNVPFGDTRLLDKDGKKSYYIHDYFLKKSLEVTRDLGIVAIITSTGLTDKRAGNILQDIKSTTDFLGGVRLPSSAFKQIAGTTVTTDILFFQKDINRDNPNNFNDEAFKPVQPYPADKRVFVNPYFLNHPEQILGFIQIQNYHGATLTVVGNGDLIPKLHKALQNVSAISNLGDLKFYGAEVHLDVPTLDDPDLYLGSHKHKLIFVTKDQFLSGDVVTKRDELQQLVTEKDKKANWSHYLEMIKKVIPKPLTVADISFKLSSNWIPDKVLSSFLVHYFKNNNDVDFDWSQNLIMHSPKGRSIQRDAYAYMTWSEAASQNKYTVQDNGETVAPYTDAIYIINYLLNSKQPTISTKVGEDKKGKPIYRPNAVLTAQLREVEARIEKLFHDYIMNDDSLVKVIEDSYNKLYNRIVNKKYDGSHLHIDGLSKAYHLRDYQANAVERIIETGRALLAHEVGTGKTLTMISAGFKLKELGLIHRPLYVVPTNLVGQFGQDILKFYPTKKVLITSRQDFQKQNRKRFFARFITGDYDAIVIGHSQFEKIQVSPENKKIFLKDALDKLSGQIDQMNSEGTFQNYTVKELERRKNGIKKHLKAQQDLRLRQDTFMNFEELGIDFLFVDEAHNFKNIAPNTSLGQIKGINQSTSKKALDMRMKVRLMQKRFDNKHVVFSTGTPVSNSISELWTMMSYIQPDVLKKFQIDNFDNWVGNFGLIETVLELNTTGNKYQARKRFVKFVNLPELMHIYRITADVKMADQTSLERPRAKKFVIKSELTPAQKDKLQELIDRTDAIKNHAVTPDKDNMLKITNEARKLTLDMRLFNTSLVKYSPEDSEKLSQVADNVYRIWKRTTPNKGTQIIFSDLGTPKAKTDFDVYNAVSDLLQKRGIPKREIAFMHQANTAEAKLELSRKVNAGQIRVVIGSTQKGGTGLNIQRRMKAAHHLDVPWRPSDIIQRNGRLVRQGNMYREVEIYHYITKGSFDNYLWQIQENKLKYITQIMTSNSPIRAMHDVDSETMTASDFKAIATQNPYLKLKMQIDNQLVLLRNEKNSFVRNYRANVIDRQKDKEYLPVLKDQIKNLKSDLGMVKPYLPILKGTDIEMANGQKHYSNGALLNSRLHKEVENIVFGSSDKKGTMKTIGKIAGLDIKAQYDTYDITTRYYRKTFWADLWLVGKGSYDVEINLSLDSSNYPVKIKNAVEKLPDNLNKEQGRLRELQARLKRDLGSKEFSKQLQIDYLSEKKSVLDPLIEGDSKVEIIKTKMTKFDSNFKLVHPNFVPQTDENKEKLTKVKYQNDPNDFDDSLFEDVKNKLVAQNQAQVVKKHNPILEVHTTEKKADVSKKSPKQVAQPQPVKVITPASHQSQADGQSTQLSLFDMPSDKKDADDEDTGDDKPIIGTVQTSLF